MPDKYPPMNILRAARAAQKLGVSRATFYAWQNPGSPYHQASLPLSIPLGKRAVGWLECELDAWLEARAEQRSPGGKRL